MENRKSIALVTGASSGLGAEFVRQLDRKKTLDEIWVIARRRQRLEALQNQVCTPLRILDWDLTDLHTVEMLSQLLATETPVIRILVNAAGFGKIGSYRDISLTDCNDMIHLNCRAAVDMIQLSIPYMAKGSRILTLCSTSAFQPFPYLNIYAATKAFLYRYSRALRVELLGTGIHVTAVCPYWIKDTEFIPIARRTANSSYIRGFPLASHRKRIVTLALSDSRLNLPVSTPGVICMIHRIVAKFIPHSVMMGMWAGLRRL